mmetsp:Transcript_5649/g.13690  ORF Transcript_5649/g.13690 Transcript_5649/m.13690 type:complete len:107 (-) Transcript_5649:4060-4380(-)
MFVRVCVFYERDAFLGVQIESQTRTMSKSIGKCLAMIHLPFLVISFSFKKTRFPSPIVAMTSRQNDLHGVNIVLCRFDHRLSLQPFLIVFVVIFGSRRLFRRLAFA